MRRSLAGKQRAIGVGQNESKPTGCRSCGLVVMANSEELTASQLHTPENGCLAVSFLAIISSALGEFFIALAMAIIVAS